MEQTAIFQLLTEQFGDALLAWNEEGPEPFASVKPEEITEVARFLREDPRLEFNLLMCLSGIDWDGLDESGKGKSVPILSYHEDGTPEISDRVAEGDFGLAYHLYSYRHEHKFALQVRMPRQDPVLPSVSGIWPSAAWHEREVYDLFGVKFSGHNDLRRILLEEGWEGHPLRKDYQMPDQWREVPLEGKPYSKNPHRKEEPSPAASEEGDR